MKNFKVGCSPITNRIFAGTVDKKGFWGANKTDVTDTAPDAVAKYLLNSGTKIEYIIDGQKYHLKMEKVK